MIERLVDAHHHLWTLADDRYPWLRTPADPVDGDPLAPIRHDYGVGEYLDDAGPLPLRASVHVEAAFDPSDPVAETRWVAAQADAHGWPTVLVAAARLQLPDLEDTLSAHLESDRVRGVRQMLNWTPDEPVAERDGLLEDPAWRAGLRTVERFGLSFDLQVFPHQLESAARIAAEHPGLTLILDHGGYAQRDTPKRRELWRRGIRMLAREPNVTVKASAYSSIDPTFSTTGLAAYLLDLIEVFGADRVMFASNFPVDRPHVGFQRLVASYHDALCSLSPAERDAVFFGTAARSYRIEPAGTEPDQEPAST